MSITQYPANGSNPDVWDAALKGYLDKAWFQHPNVTMPNGRWADIGKVCSDKGQQFSEAQLVSVTYCGHGIVLAGTYSGNKVLRSTDWGETWSDLGSQSTGQAVYLQYIGGGIVVGATYSSGNIIRSTDYGLNWTDLGDPLSVSHGSRISYLGNGVCLVGTTSGIGDWGRSTDFGLNWTDKGVLSGSVTSVLRADTNNDGLVLLPTTNNGELYESDDEGDTFTLVGTIGSEIGLKCVKFIGNRIWLIGSGSGKVWRSTDNGVTFGSLGQLGSATDIDDFCIVSPGVILAISQGGGVIFRSDDWGATWTSLGQIGSETALLCCTRLDNSEILIGTGSGHIWKTGG